MRNNHRRQYWQYTLQATPATPCCKFPAECHNALQLKALLLHIRNYVGMQVLWLLSFGYITHFSLCRLETPSFQKSLLLNFYSSGRVASEFHIKQKEAWSNGMIDTSIVGVPTLGHKVNPEKWLENDFRSHVLALHSECIFP